ncbi:MAG TPA: 2-C-methyl-D-erythritol 4-phosphate cytidylyltransferase [Thermodesulfobacteriota bacterium]|nr:2-C-methyl-D-erythritol 4-phosphate cytidylyltransferase [Thermodesulfobacteriota bacterium]
MTASAIITAGGRGARFGSGAPKQFAALGGKPLLAHSVETFSSLDIIGEIVLVAPDDWVPYVEEMIAGIPGSRVSRVVPGGPERQHSVENGLSALSGTPEVVVIHDGVRPFAEAALIEEVIREARAHGAALAALPAGDTVKKAGETGLVESTVPRDTLWLAQTPQAFRYGVLREAFERARKDGFLATDEALLAERIGARVRLVRGSPLNIKITTREDLALGELLLKLRAEDGSE